MTTVHFVETFYKVPSLHTYRARCGKPTCRCANGEGHGPYAFLHWREGTTQRRRYVRQADLDAVREVIIARQQRDRLLRYSYARSLANLRELRTWLNELHD